MELLEQKTAQLAAVRDISRAIAEAQDLKSALTLITRRTTEVMNMDCCSIYLYDRQDNMLTLAASTGLRSEAIGLMSLPAGAGLTGWAVKHNQAVAVSDAQADPRFYRLIGSGESRFVSLMAMPLITQGKVIGAANVQTLAVHPFTDYELELFGIITDLAATALEKAKLVHAAVVQEIHHRVKNNLQTIALLLRLQISQADQLTAEHILNETINRVLSIAAVHEILAQEHQDSIGLKLLVEQVTQAISKNLILGDHIQIEVIGDDVLLPSQIATNLALVTNELLQNALDHGLVHQNGGLIRIWLKIDKTMFYLIVQDNGQGLPENFDLDHYQGLGLQLVHTMIVEDMGGRFSMEPNTNGGAKATICISLESIQGKESYATEEFI